MPLLFIPTNHPDRRQLLETFPEAHQAEIHNYIAFNHDEIDLGRYYVKPVEDGFISGTVLNVNGDIWRRNWSYPRYIPVLTMPWGLAEIPSY